MVEIINVGIGKRLLDFTSISFRFGLQLEVTWILSGFTAGFLVINNSPSNLFSIVE